MLVSKANIGVLILFAMGIAFTSAGIYYFVWYQKAPNYISRMELGAVDLRLSNGSDTFRVSTFEFEANAPRQSVGVYMYFAALLPGRYDFAIILPVKLSNWTGHSDGVSMTFRNASEDGSVVFGSYEQNTTGWTNVNLNAGGTTPDVLVSGSRGDYSLYIPLASRSTPSAIGDVLTESKFPGFYDGLTYWNETQVEANIGIGSNNTLDLIYPPSAFPSASPFPQSQGDWFLWTFKQPQYAQPIIVHYSSETEAASYQSDLFYSGLSLGIGIPMLAGVVMDIVRLASREA